MQPPFPIRPTMIDLDAADTDASSTALSTLHDRTRDALKGYETKVEKAEPSFRATVQKFHSLHLRHAEKLAQLLRSQGQDVDEDGTLMGTVNKMVVTVRSFFDDIDADTLVQIRDGEDWVLQAFDDAIVAEGEGTTADTLRQMRAELSQLLAAT